MARSLARNTRVFVSTLTLDNLTAGNITSENTFEIKVLDGYSFSQDVATQEIGVNEADSEAACAAAGLARGTLSFNTALNPVDVSFSTYVRPYDNTSTADCVERVLWSSAMGTAAGFAASPDTPANGATYNVATDSSTYEHITFSLATSNSNNLLPLTMIFTLENATYVIQQFNVNSAEVDFSIDGIATINWSGNGSRVSEEAQIHNLFKDPGGTLVKTLVQGATTGRYLGVPATTTSTFLRNKLSTLELYNNELPTASLTILPADYTISTTTITYTPGGLTIDAYNTYAIYNQTTDDWDLVTDTTGTTIVTQTDTGWNDSTDTLVIYPIVVMANATVTNTDPTAPTIADATLSLTTNAYAGGRVRKLNSDVTATILSNTATTITLAQALPTGWASTDEFMIFTESQQGAIIYCIPITGATLTLENNITYLTPEELAIVNLPLAGFAGSRRTSGSFTAYLNTGAQGSGGLLADLLAKIEDSVTTNYHVTFHMGGDSTSYPRVDFDIPHAQISVPTTNVEDIISTEISFAAKPWDTTNNVASFEDTNEMTITYAIPYTA
jgi:hypothetical protein